MSLWESGDSSGEVSLASLLEGGRCVAKDAEQTYSGVADLSRRVAPHDQDGAGHGPSSPA